MADSGPEIVGDNPQGAVQVNLSVTQDSSKEASALLPAVEEEGHNGRGPGSETFTKPTPSDNPVFEADKATGNSENLTLTAAQVGKTVMENVGPTPPGESLMRESSEALIGQQDKQSQPISSTTSLVSSPAPCETSSSLDKASSHSTPGLGGVIPSSPCLAEDALGQGKETIDGAAAALSGATASPEAESTIPAYYFVKWITWKEKKTPIITQSENGPCPLLAIMNTLFLRWKAKLPAQTEVITTEDLMAYLGECVLAIKARENAEGMELNFQQNMSDAMGVLPKLSTGLDVNVRFTGVSEFEYTPECIVFDLLDIPLYHGWLVDPQSPEMVKAVGKLTYNQLVEKIIDYKHSTDSSHISEGLVAEQFLESTATQLSYHGLCELNTTATEGELSVFFRNNHFSTMIKHMGHLYLLVTDQGFLQEQGLVWESLHNVEGDGNFCDSNFRLCHPPQRNVLPPEPSMPSPQQQRQIDQDYLVAMSLQQQGMPPGPFNDLELARQLQQEEYQQQQQQQQQQQGLSQPQPQQVRGQGTVQQGSQRRRPEKKDDSDCVLL